MKISKDNDISGSRERTITISKNDLAAVALLYNFLSKNSTSLSSSEIEDFYRYVSSLNYCRPWTTFKFTEKEDPEYDFLEFAWGFGTDGFDSSGAEIEETDWIGISKSEKDYKIENIDRIIFNCKSIPEEVLSSTLSSDVLGLIGVNRDNLKIQNVTKNYKDYMNVYSMSETQAIKKVVKRLEEHGFKNVKIGSVFYKGMMNDHVFEVRYNSQRTFYTLNFEKIKK